MRPHTFFLLVISIALLVGCAAPASPLAEVSVLTSVPPAVVAIAASPTTLPTFADTASTAVATSLPTVVSIAPPAVTETQPPVTMTPYVPPTGYPIPETPAPTATPHYTADGQWQIVTKQATRFEIPAAWFVDYSEMTNYPLPVTDAPPPTPTDGSGLIKLEYREINYHRYAGYTGIENAEIIQVAGYPTRRLTECSESWFTCYFSLLIEGNDQVYTLILYINVNPTTYAEDVARVQAQGDMLMQHIMDTLEVTTPVTAAPAIGIQETFTATVASVDYEDTLANMGTIYLVPSPDHPYTEIEVWNGATGGTHMTSDGSSGLLISQIHEGATLQITGRPLSDSKARADAILRLPTTN